MRHGHWLDSTMTSPQITTQTPSNRPLRSRHLLVDLAANAALLIGLWFLYALVRRLTADAWTEAVVNAAEVVNFQNALGLPSEARVQSLVLENATVVRAFNFFYMWGHFPVTGAFVAWVFLFRRHAFPVIRDSLIVLTGAGLVLHLIFPLAPPRILPGFIDTGAIFGPSPYDLAASSAANQLAAMPSLHVGWAMIVAISVISLLHSRWRFLAIVHPIVTAVVVVVTANHYWIDAIVAVLLVVFAWEFSARLAHRQLMLRTAQTKRSNEVIDLTDADHRRRELSSSVH